jgi:poly(hydroxyalkanoate) depolymerase family esterase
MKIDLAAALGEATPLTRTQKLAEATRLIQEVLSGDRNTTSAVNLRSPAPTDAPARLSDPRAERPDSATPAEATTDHSLSAGRQSMRIRRPLGETLKLLRRGALGTPKPLTIELPTRRKRPYIPEGAQFLTRSFTLPSGTRAYKLYVPRHPDAVTGLVVMLHGCTQNPDDFAIGTGMNEVAEERGLIVAYPAQSRVANPSLCWNWFHLRDQKRGSGEPAIIAGLTEELIAEFGIGSGRVFIAGLSAGGAMAAVMGATYPDIYAAVGVHSGLRSGTAGDLISALAAMRGNQRHRALIPGAAMPVSVRTIVFHGDADQTVHPSNGDSIVTSAKAGLKAEQQETQWGHSPGGIDYLRTVSRNAAGLPAVEHWLVCGVGHAWSGGNSEGSYTDPRGPNASREMVRFFLEQPATTIR